MKTEATGEGSSLCYPFLAFGLTIGTLAMLSTRGHVLGTPRFTLCDRGIFATSAAEHSSAVAPLAATTSAGVRAAAAARGTWVYLLGDSSIRMFNAALIERLNGTLDDRRFGSYKIHDKGGCTDNEAVNGQQTFACLREFIDWRSNTRVTFTFKTYAKQRTAVLDHLTSHASMPDVPVWVLKHEGRIFRML